MTVTLVCDPSDATELCASQRLYLKPVAKLTISVVFPEHTGPPRALSKLEVMDKLKNMICPDQFTSVKVSKSTKGFIRFEGEVETKRLVCSLKEKLHGKMIKLNGFKDSLQVVATEEPPDLPAPQEPEPVSNDGELLEEDFAEQSRDIPDCLRLEGLPCKWFSLKGSDSEMPNEDVLRAVFEGFGKIKNIDIPMLDPYREETVGGHVNSFAFRGLRTFEAYVQYQEPTAFAKAMETLTGMKLMLKGEDGKAFACNIKVTSDMTNHFSESAINHRHLERLTLQGLERERKREETRAKRGTERKRRDDDDEKKVGEGKRKSKIKRREKRQIDRDDKRPRKQQKLTAGEALWPENMPEWEERKYLLAQRRVESIRLLTVLLSQIKDFVLSSRQTGEPLLSLANRREDCLSAPQIQNAPKEAADFHYFGYEELNDEGELKCRSAQLENTHFGGEEDEEQYVGTDQPASPRLLGRTVLNGPAARAVTSRLTDKDTDCYRGRGLLQVTVTQECKVAPSPDNEDSPGLNWALFSKVPNAGSCKKQKVYETEEFIHYLLNYYQTPRYARICPVTENVETESWWQRVVSQRGDGFQVSLKSREDLCVAGVSFEPGLPEEGSRESDNDQWEVMEEEPGPVEVPPENRACHREFPPNSPGQWDDSLGETSDRTAREDLNSPFLGSTVTPRDGRSQEGPAAGVGAVRSRKSLGRMYKLKDLLEEISSDSECFSEALEPRSKMEKRNGGCRSSCKAWPLSRQGARELLICIQNVARGDQGGACSRRSFCCDLTKHPRQRLKAAPKRSGSKARREELKAKCPSSDEEKEACRKKKKKSAGNSLPHGNADFFKTNHCGELESLSKMQRKCSKMLQQKTKCKTLHAGAGMGKAKDAIHLGASQLQEARPEAGDFLLRREVEADSEPWPLFPIEIIQTSPYPESVCGAELGRGC